MVRHKSPVYSKRNKCRPAKTGKSNLFSGVAYCADCGEKLYYCTTQNFEERRDHFVCSTSRKKGKDVCGTHFIRAMVLEKGVLKFLQILAYMFRFDAKKGFYFYPEMGEEEDAVMWLNRGSTYEKNVEAREDICLIKHGFQIPTGIDEYSAFIEQMRCNEFKFLDGILTFVK